jgi:hypothetical protein
VRHSLLLLILGLAFSTIIACGTPTPRGEPAEHARINAMTDCTKLREEFKHQMALFNTWAVTDSTKIALAYSDTAKKRSIDLGCGDPSQKAGHFGGG